MIYCARAVDSARVDHAMVRSDREVICIVKAGRNCAAPSVTLEAQLVWTVLNYVKIRNGLSELSSAKFQVRFPFSTCDIPRA
jgi:hypothetical protein